MFEKYEEKTCGDFEKEFPGISDLVKIHGNATYISRYWNEFKKISNKTQNFEEADIKRYFEYLFTKVVDPAVVKQNHKPKFFAIYFAQLYRTIDQDFPKIGDWIDSRCDELSSQRNCEKKPIIRTDFSKPVKPFQEKIWTKLCQMTQKQDGFTDAEMTTFFKLESETYNWKPEKLKAVKYLFRRFYLEKHGRHFNVDFPETCQFISQTLKSKRGGEEVHKAGNNPKPRSLSKKTRRYYESLWTNLCEKSKKEVGFTDDEMISFFKIESETKSWKPITIGIIYSMFIRLYQEKFGKSFKDDFPKTCIFIAEKTQQLERNFDGKENKNSNNLPQNNDSMNKSISKSNSNKNSEDDTRRSEVWKEFCNFTKKSEDFDEQNIIDFMQSETTKSQRMTKWLYPLAEAYTLKFDKDFWFEYPNVFRSLLKKEQ